LASLSTFFTFGFGGGALPLAAGAAAAAAAAAPFGAFFGAFFYFIFKIETFLV